jgi:DNA-binding MarR family transcriptional regulator
MGLEDEIKQCAFKDEHRKALINLIYTNHWILGRQKLFFKKYDLTPQQYNILRILRGKHPEGITLMEIKDRMLDRTSDASRLVERLRLKFLLEKEVSEKDKRATNIKITEKGLASLLEIDESIHKLDSELSVLSEDEVQQLNAILDKIRN